MLTSHRLLWLDYGGEVLPGNSCWIPLSAVEKWTVHQSIATRLNLRQQKLKVEVFEGLDGKPAEDGLDALHCTTIRFIFNETLPSNFDSQLRAVLEQKSWNSVVRQNQSDQTDQVRSEFQQQLIEMVRIVLSSKNRTVF